MIVSNGKPTSWQARKKEGTPSFNEKGKTLLPRKKGIHACPTNQASALKAKKIKSTLRKGENGALTLQKKRSSCHVIFKIREEKQRQQHPRGESSTHRQSPGGLISSRGSPLYEKRKRGLESLCVRKGKTYYLVREGFRGPK